MKKLLLLLASGTVFGFTASAQVMLCDTSGNLIIYSNYDGGPLTINVDQNIPNLKIGIVSYEYATINITGTYASNVTAVRWAGYNGTNNHCNGQPPYNTTISGVPNSVDTIIQYPSSTYSNPNGYSSIICAYSCNTTTNQGGCNTADQIAHYFLTTMGGSLRYHHTQYGCWQGTMAVSMGGNCCANPTSLGTTEMLKSENISVYPNPATDDVTISMNTGSGGEILATIFNSLGQCVKTWTIQGSGEIRETLSLSQLPEGVYQLRFTSGEKTVTKSLSVVH